MEKLIRNIISFAALLLIVFTVGCSTNSDSGTGTLEVKLHDAPVAFDEVNIFVERIEINKEDSEEGWIVVSEPNQSYNILELVNGEFEVLGITDLETGFYQQFRLIVSRDNNSVVIDGETHDLFIPSGAQTGVKLNINAEIEEDIRYVLLLDFDAKRSVVEAGQAAPLSFLLKPVIRATNEAITGNISGTVTPVDAQPAVYAIVGNDTLSTTFADEVTGEFKLIGLEEGTYTVSVEPQEGDYAEETIDGVEVLVGETTELDATIELTSGTE
ncbi:MAG TPA: DUF4382 domain-containing protein [Balneolaceae bacterium]|nr:DUF4382 domain-containing protein [Balneolaceae bacterium]